MGRLVIRGFGFVLVYELVLGNTAVWGADLPKWIRFALPPVWDLDGIWLISPLLFLLSVLAAVVLVDRYAPGTEARRACWLAVAIGLGAAAGHTLWLICFDTFIGDLRLEEGESDFAYALISSITSSALFGITLGALAAGFVYFTRNAQRPIKKHTHHKGAGPVADLDSWPHGPTEATRLLCGAVYWEPWFADRVVRNLLSSRVRAVATSPGVSTTLVLRHALTVYRLRMDLEVRLLLAFIATVLLVIISWWLLIAGLLGGAALLTHHWYTLRRRVHELFDPEEFAVGAGEPDPPPAWTAQRFREVEAAERGNVTVFSGFRPFVGYGAAEAGWSFSLPIRPSRDHVAKRDFRPFAADELTTRVRHRLSAIGDPDGIGDPLTVAVEERVFVDGTSLDERFLPDRTHVPDTSLDHDLVDEIVADPGDAARCYLVAHVPSWGGLVVASTFLRFSTNGHMLHAECERAVLRPIGSNLRIDEHGVEVVKPHEFVDKFLGSIGTAIGRLPAAPFALVRYALLGRVLGKQAAREQDQALDDQLFDYGTAFSVRESAAGGNFYNQFQRRDAEKGVKLVEQHVLEAVIEFLEERGVDTAELRSRQTTILNQGVIQTGGTSNVGALAVGDQAQASSTAEAR
ncbi:hypothetical protein V5P93_000500 [Actinokineospora auranticolor]|uniref:Uncharacterized protein n=1 Tax=Actinokineospora auranticolor TaxID=155976 RepID=A0A2S6GZN7_9PSEU|nr:hypothetical protein [Actinokineospora auranticolor]PPK70620.1 hypothetical protein CLV40_102537 [Actinokineospora auranticolor]